MKIGCAAVALLALAGCAEVAPDEAPPAEERRAEIVQAFAPKWHASLDFSTDERRAIVEGMAWLDAQSDHRSRGVAFDNEPGPYRIERSLTHNSPGVCLNMVDHVGGTTVLLNPANNDPELHPLVQTVAHELAHCELGFRDAYWPSPVVSQGLMGGVYMKWTEYEANEVALFNAAR